MHVVQLQFWMDFQSWMSHLLSLRGACSILLSKDGTWRGGIGL